MTILTEDALRAAPTLTLIEAGEHPTARSLADALGRDEANLSKTLKAYEQAGWIERPKGARPVLTDAGREVLAALDRANNPAAEAAPEAGEGLREIPIVLIERNPGQPRQRFTEDEIAELAASIRDKGVLQPVLVRPAPKHYGHFEIVAGERRWRAATAAGLDRIPAMVRDLDDAQAFEAATIENVQRQDMTPMEEARAFERIVADRMAADAELKFKDAKAVVAERLKKTVRYVEQRMALLQLPEAKQAQVDEGTLSVTDARKWLQSRPKPLDLSASLWLLALEVFDRVQAAPLASDEYSFDARMTEVHADARFDTKIAALTDYPSQLLCACAHILDDVGETGRFKVGVSYNAAQHLTLKFRVDVEHADLRAAALAEARTAAGQPNWKPARYVTPWLNGPFDVQPGLAKEIAEARAKRQAEQEARDRAANARRIDAARAQEAAEARLAQAAAIVEAARGFAALIHPEFRITLEATGKPLPWLATDKGDLLAADGSAVANAPYNASPDLIARQKLIALAVNAAAGVATPTEAEFLAQIEAAEDRGHGWREDEPEGEAEDGEDPEFEDEDEDEPEAEEAADAPEPRTLTLADARAALEPEGDSEDEFSPALLKLAGVRDAAPSHH